MERPGTTPPPRWSGPAAQSADPAQQSLVSALRSSFAVLRLVMLVLVVLYLSSGVFRIQPGEQGLIARLGALVENKETGKPVFNQGWIWWALPDPFDEKIHIKGDIQRLEIDTFMFQRTPDDIAKKTDIATIRPTGNALTPGKDGAMLTGDRNLSHGLWEVEYRIADAARFVENVYVDPQNMPEDPHDIEPLLRRLFETAIIREVSFRKVEDVTRTKTEVVADGVRQRLQEELNALHTGVEVMKVNAKTIVPAQVAPAFAEVTNAENERKKQEHEARQKATEILNQAAGPQYKEILTRIAAYGAAQLASADASQLETLRNEIDASLDDAQGEVAATLREARATADTVLLEIGREYEQFTYWQEQYHQFPQATLISLWSAMRQEVLDNKDNEIFWVPDSNVIDIIVNRDLARALEAQRAELKKKLEGR